MSDKVNTLCLSFLCGPMIIGLIWLVISMLADRAERGTGAYPPQRAAQDVSRSYDPFGAMETQRTDYGDVNEVARLAYDHANGGHGAGVTGKVVVYDSDFNQHETSEYIKVIQKVAHQGNNNLTIERRRGDRP